MIFGVARLERLKPELNADWDRLQMGQAPVPIEPLK